MSPSFTAIDGGRVTIANDAVAAFGRGLRGGLVTAQSPDYDQARSVWNAMIDRRPGLIARCAGAADVVRALRFAREQGLLVAVRGAGHNIAGSAVCDGGLVIDLSALRWSGRSCGAHGPGEPGARLADLDGETQAFALAVPVGINSTTGIAGLTLGGGFGWLSRKHGMTVDNLLSADVVTADGQLVTASAEENTDLFWGLRGGGGNFGIVTSFEFRLHPVGPEVLSGLVVHRLRDARAALQFYRDFAAQAPDELTTWVVMRKAPPLPFLPAEVHGTEVIVFALMYAGDLEEGQRRIAPLLKFGKPVGQMVMPQPYASWQQAFDPLLTPGARNYWKSHNFQKLDDGLLDVLIDNAGRLPSPHCEIFLAQMGGAEGRVAPEATAYPHRDISFIMNVHARWEDRKDDERCVSWARSLFVAAGRYATGGAYVNFMPDDEQERVPTAYGKQYERLAALKGKWDPTNVFRLNQNIVPTRPRT